MLRTQIPRIVRGALRTAAGILLILVGIVGLALPAVPGWVLISFGVALLAPKTAIARGLRRAFEWLAAKFPRRKTESKQSAEEKSERRHVND